jgi:glycosyltransferase involved in cell wall biosynthesis
VSKGIETFVFAHGRGRYLENCLRSLNAVRWEGAVTVFDDGSTDRASLRVLREAEQSGVHVERRATKGQGTWGGLQANMGRALEVAQGPLVLFIQDDTQVVRRPTAEEVSTFGSFVRDERNSPFLFPSFQMESWGAQRNPDRYRYDAEKGMWYRTEQHRFAGFSDVSLFDVDRLRSAGWDPGFVEKEAAARAMELFGPMAIIPYPFVAFLPYPHTPRRGLRYRIKQPKRFRAPASIKVMSTNEAAAFMRRDPTELAFASRDLQLESALRQRIVGRYWSH